jgi:serine/threonine protein kinase/tetratricopeptide (TPR) repeat protein
MLNRTNGAGSPSASNSSVLAELVDRLTGQVQAGEAIDWEAVARQYPQHVEELRGLLPALGAIDELSRSGDEALSGVGRIRVPVELESGVLGDFRIIREVGRGGMGVVYEAEQVSLGRRVALKVLPFAATMDPRHLQRFHNEARAAASLHHEHIVPVYGVGQERGVHYYAMQFIDGPTLAQLMARGRGGAPADTADRTHAPSEPAAAPPAPAAQTTEARAADTAAEPRSPADYRAAAEWVVQAAEALEHAHALGIVHRDVKPGNLMLDGQSKVWVTDFGLARLGADGGLTGTGDVIGTLRYMSPEQATAKHGLVDHRTDVYGLGATLYELLAGRPAFGGDNPADLVPRVVLDEPAPPRSSHRGIPADLETITLKAMAKDPADRYQSAQELADDLRRWLEDRPIQAKPPGTIARVQKWARRHQPAVLMAATFSSMSALALGACTAWVWHAKGIKDDALAAEQQANQQKEAAFQDAAAKGAEAQLNLEAAKKNLLTIRDSGRAFEEIGSNLVAEGREPDGSDALMLALDILDRVDATFPAPPVEKDHLQRKLQRAQCLMRLGDAHLQLGKVADAEKRYGEAIPIWAAAAAAAQGSTFFYQWQHARALASWGNALADLGRPQEAETACRNALALLAQLPPRKLPPSLVSSVSAEAHAGLGVVLWSKDRRPEAATEFGQAQADWEAAQAAVKGKSHEFRNDLAAFLMECPDPQRRDPALAVRLVEEAVRMAPKDGHYRLTLGVAQYRAGQPAAALSSFDDAELRLQELTPAAWLYRAMAHWKCRHKDEARRCFERAEKTIATDARQRQTASVRLSRLHAEAAALLEMAKD